MIVFDKVRWKNFLSTGNRFTEIDFTESKANLIVGENGSGKSTFLDALTFSLFAKPYRKINKPQLVNSINKKDCVVEVEFSIGTNSYFIKRGIKPNIFEIYINGNLIDQDSKIKDYQEKLEKNILKFNYKSFTQIIILGSSSFQPFMKLPTYIRREVIEDLLDIQVFSLMNILLKDKLQNSKKLLNDNSSSTSIIKEKVELQEKYIEEVKEINNNKIERFLQDLKKGENEIDSNKDDIEEIMKECSELNEELKKQNSCKQSKQEIDNILNKILLNQEKLETDIKFFDDNENCPTCTQPIDINFKQTIVNAKTTKKSSYGSAIDDLKKQLIILDERLEYFNKIIEYISQKNITITQLSASNRGLEKFNKKIEEEVDYLQKVKEKSHGDEEKLYGFLEEFGALQETREELLEYKKYLDITSTILKDTGVKTTIIKQYLPIMNQLINEYLVVMDSYFNFTLDENFDEHISSLNRESYSYNSFSEGEKLRIDLALLFTWRAVSKLKNNTNSNLLILDEVFDGSLDNTGVELFFRLLDLTQKNTNVFVITHKTDSYIDRFDRIIKFEKNNNFSQLVDFS